MRKRSVGINIRVTVTEKKKVTMLARKYGLLLDKLARSCTLGNAQNERAAIIERRCSKGIGYVAPTSGFAKIVNLYRFTLLANL